MSHFHSRIALFKSPAYTWFIINCLTATIGGGMGYIAMTWLILDFDNSLKAVAILMACFWIPGVILGPFTGVITDHFQRRTYLIAISSGMRGIVFTGFGLWLWHAPSALALYLLALIGGVFFTLYMPAAFRLVREIVKPHQLMPANATIDMAYEIGSVIGMGVVGLLIHWLNGPIVLIINGLFYFVATFAVLMIRRKDLHITPPENTRLQVIQDFKAALQYLLPNKKLLLIYLIQLVVFILFMTGPVLSAPFAKAVLHVNAQQFGILEASLSIGIVFGGLWMPWFAEKYGIAKVVFVTSTGLAISFIAFAHNRNLHIAYILYGIIGFCFAIWAVVVTQAQQLTNVTYQGRLQSFINCISNIGILVMFYLVTLTNHWISITSLYWVLALLAVIVTGLLMVFNRYQTAQQ